MNSQSQTQTSPDKVVPRFCGYCGTKFSLNQEEFLKHVHGCEKIRVDMYHNKRGDQGRAT